ncbi:MAG TPA: hypothetical protein VIK18_25555 [Pirellulales bacterium]
MKKTVDATQSRLVSRFIIRHSAFRISPFPSSQVSTRRGGSSSWLANGNGNAAITAASGIVVELAAIHSPAAGLFRLRILDWGWHFAGFETLCKRQYTYGLLSCRHADGSTGRK